MQYKVSVIKCPLFTGVGGPVLGPHVGHDPGPEPGDEPGDQVGEVVVEVEQREVRPGAGPAGLQPPGHPHQHQPRPPAELFNFYIDVHPIYNSIFGESLYCSNNYGFANRHTKSCEKTLVNTC